jgi:hypothetical protein
LATQKKKKKRGEYAVADTLFSLFFNHEKFEKKALFLEEISPHFGTVFTVL